MSRKISVRLQEELYQQLLSESQRFGYRGISSYITVLLEQRQVIEIEGGTRLAESIFRYLKENNLNSKQEGREEVCHLLGSLMTEIVRVKSLQP